MAENKDGGDGGRLTRKMRALLAEARAYLSPRKLRQALAQAVRPAWSWAYAFSPSFAGLGRRWWQARGINTARRRVPTLRTLETLEPRVLLSGSYLYVNTDWNLVADKNNNGVMDTGDTVSNLYEDNSLQNLTFGVDAFANINDALVVANSGQKIVMVSGSYGSAYSATVNKSVTIEGWKYFAANDAAGDSDVTQGNLNPNLTTVFNGASLTITSPNVTVEGIGFNGAPSTGAVRVNDPSATATILDDAFNTGAVGVRIDSGSATLESSNTFGGVTTGVLVNAGGTATDISSTFTNTPTAVDVEGGAATVSGAGITGGTTGVKIGSGSLIVNSTDGAVQITNATTAVQVAGGTASVSGAVISGATTGIDVTGGTLTVGAGDSITGGATGLLISGSTASISGDSLNNLSFSGQSGNYITLASGALNSGTPVPLDATGASFGGVVGDTLTSTSTPTAYAIENKIGDYLDASTLGYVELNAAEVFVAQDSDLTAQGGSPGAIQRGVNVVASGDTVNVQAGTFTGGVQISKAVKLLGANATANPTNGGARGGESIIEPGVSGADPYAGTHTFLIEVLASNVTIEGFTLTGQNDSLGTANGVELTGTTTYAQAAEGIAAYDPTGVDNISASSSLPGTATPGNVTIENNIIEDLSYQGVDMGWGTSGTTPTSGNVISDNLIQNIGAYNDEGDAVRLYNNFYANVTGNQILNVRMGIEAGNFWTANSGTTGSIEYNQIQARRRDIFYNLFYENATAMPVEYNTITATADDPTFVANGSLWTGVYVISQTDGTNTATFLDNSIDGSGSNYTLTAGYTLLNTWATSGVIISGDAGADNSITNVSYGIWETTGDPNGFGANAAADMGVTISGVNITASQIGVYVEEDPSYNTTYTVSATIDGDTSITTNTTSGTGIEVSGAKASATVSGNDAISGNATGILVSGGTATIGETGSGNGNHIYDNTTGIDFTAGGGGSVTGNDFTGTTVNGTDLNVDSTAGTVTDGGGNAFAGTQYINDLESGNSLTATTDKFGGVLGSALTTAQGWAAEDKISDYLDNQNYGYVELNASNVFVAQSSETANADAIQRGVDKALSGNTVNVQVGDYVGDVTIGTSSLTLDGGGAANVTAPATASNAAIISVAAADVTVEGFNITVDQPYAAAGIAAISGATGPNVFNNLSILNNTIVSTGSGGSLATPFNDSSHNAGIAVLANGGGTAPSVTISGNVILPTLGDPTVLKRAIWVSEVEGTIGGASLSQGNTVAGSYEDVLDAFARGTTTISNNTFDGAGVTITEPNADAPISVSKNTFDSELGGVDDASLEVKHDYNGVSSPVTISGNTFTVLTNTIGVLSADSTGVSVTGNTFAPAMGATGTVDIDVDTMVPSGSQPTPLVLNSISVTGNTFNADAGSDATAIRFANDNANASFGAITIGGFGSDANTFSKNMANFIVEAPPASTVTFSGDSYTPTLPGNVAVDIDASDNVFGVSSGDTLANHNFTLADYYEVEGKVLDGVDYSGAGLVSLTPGTVYVAQSSEIYGAGSLQRAVDLAASNGDGAIDVQAGAQTYAGGVTIASPVTIIGDSQSGVTVVPASGAGNNQAAFLIQSSNVTIENLTINGQANTMSSDQFADGVITEYSAVGGQYLGINTVEYDHLTAENLTVEDVSSRGIDFKNQGSNYNIVDNTLIDAGPQAVTIIGGSGVITGNIISDNTGQGIGIASNALYDAFGHTYAANLTIQGNQITGENAGLYLSGLADGSMIGGTVDADANTIDVTNAGSGAVGILISYAQGTTTIQKNQITAAGDADGILLFYDTIGSVQVLDNTIEVPSLDVSGADGSGNAAGIYITDNGETLGEPTSNGSFATILGNTIEGFATGIDVESVNNGMDQVTATIGDSTAGDSNTIDGMSAAGSTGILVTGTGASAAITDNNTTIKNNTVGIDVENGATATIDGNKFSGNSTDVKVGATGSVTSLTDNTFTATSLYIDNEAAADLNAATGNTFAGVTPSAGNLAADYSIEGKIVDGIDQSGSGLVTIVDGNLYVADSSEAAPQGSAGSIQRAVDLASAGDIVNVQAGTFTGQVSINKDLTLLGAGEALTVIQAAAMLSTEDADTFEYDGSTKQSVVTINGVAASMDSPAGVTIENLTVNGANEGDAIQSGNDFVGIGIHNSDATIDNVAVANVADTTIDGDQSGRAIFVGNDTGTHAVTIENSTVSGYQKNGIDVRGTGLTATITGNTITGANELGVTAQNGIVLGFGATGTISGNTISGDKWNTTDPQAAAILLDQAVGPVTVTDNALTGSDYGVAVFDSSAVIGDSTTVAGVTTFHGNTIAGDTIGLDVDQDNPTTPSKAVAQYNTITGDGEGVVIADGALADLGYDASDTTLGHNNFTGLGASAGHNTLTGYSDAAGHYAIDDQNTVSGSQPDVLAEDNDFGPYPLSDPAIVGEVIHDSADNAADTTVYYMPALDGQTAPTTVYVNAAWAGDSFGVDADGAGGGAMGNGIAYGYDEFSNIQDAINALASGHVSDTVNIYDGTYAEDVTVNKVTDALYIQGQDEALTKIDPAVGGGTGQTAFLIESNNVSLYNLTIDGKTNTASTDTFATGVTTNYVPATDNFLSIAATAYSDLVVQQTTVENVSGDAIAVLNQGTGDQILQDTITNAGGWGIHIHGASGVIQQNTISATADAVGVNALYDYDHAENASAPMLDIAGNTITGANVGLYLAALGNGSVVGGDVSLVPGEANQVTVSGPGAAGIIIEYANGGVTVEGNSVAVGSGGDGIVLFADGASAVGLSGNTVTGSSGNAGILVTDDNSLAALGEPAPLPTTNVTITSNSISGFSDGIDVESQGSQLISANIGDGTAANSNTITGVSSGVVIEGANASAAVDDNAITSSGDGIDLYDGSGTITYNNITVGTGTGIDFGGSSGTETVEHNTIGGTALSTGINASDVTGTMLIEDNQITAANNTGINVAPSAATTTISGNTIGTLGSATGINLIAANASDNQITGNELTNTGGAGNVGIQVSPDGGATTTGTINISGNTTITGYSAGILDNAIGTVTIENNTIIGATSTGIAVNTLPSSLTVSGNNVTSTGNATGILLENGGASNATVIADNNTLASTGNTGSGEGIEIYAATGEAATFLGNTISGYSTGMQAELASNAASFTFGDTGADDGNTISGANVGLQAYGAEPLSTVAGNQIFGNTVGIQTFAALSISNNSFTATVLGAPVHNVTDVQVKASGNTIGGGNAFAGTTTGIEIDGVSATLSGAVTDASPVGVLLKGTGAVLTGTSAGSLGTLTGNGSGTGIEMTGSNGSVKWIQINSWNSGISNSGSGSTITGDAVGGATAGEGNTTGLNVTAGDVTVTGTSFTDNTTDGIDVNGSGVTGLTVDGGNTFIGNDVGIAVQSEGATANAIIGDGSAGGGNTFSGNTTAIELDGASAATLTDNTITGGAGDVGITDNSTGLVTSTGDSISGNSGTDELTAAVTIHRAGSIDMSQAELANALTGIDDSGHLTMTGGSISDTTAGIDVEAGASATIDGTVTFSGTPVGVSLNGESGAGNAATLTGTSSTVLGTLSGGVDGDTGAGVQINGANNTVSDIDMESWSWGASNSAVTTQLTDDVFASNATGGVDVVSGDITMTGGSISDTPTGIDVEAGAAATIDGKVTFTGTAVGVTLGDNATLTGADTAILFGDGTGTGVQSAGANDSDRKIANSIEIDAWNMGINMPDSTSTSPGTLTLTGITLVDNATGIELGAYDSVSLDLTSSISVPSNGVGVMLTDSASISGGTISGAAGSSNTVGIEDTKNIADGAAKGQASDPTFTGLTVAVEVAGNMTLTDNVMHGNITGILVESTGNASIGNGTPGGANTIYGNTTGVEIASGGQAAITDNDFSNMGHGPVNGTDLKLDSGAGTTSVTIGQDAFAGTQFINNQSAENLDATSDTFNVGASSAQVGGDNLTLSEAYIVEGRITDAIDQSGLGFVRLQTGVVFVAQSSETLANPDAIQRGVNAANTDETTIPANGDIVNVQAGTYIGGAVIDKSLTIAGPNAGTAGYDTDTRVPEAIVEPGADDHLTGNMFLIEASGVTIKGMTLDGSNASLGNVGAPLADGTFAQSGYGISNATGIDANDNPAAAYLVSNTNISDNIIENFAQSAITGDNGTLGATSNNTIQDNLIENISANTDTAFGYAILMLDNYYATITGNHILSSQNGIQVENFFLADPSAGPTVDLVSGNVIDYLHRGIFLNLQYESASPWTFSGNNITADADASDGNKGISIESVQGAVSETFTDNNVTGSTDGYELWNLPTTGVITVSGGTVSNTTYGIWATNNAEYGLASASSSATISGVTITGASMADIYVQGDSGAGAVNLTVKGDTAISGSPTGILVSGTNASATISGATIDPAAPTGVGVLVTGGASATLTGNTIDGLAIGVEVTGAGSTATIGDSSDGGNHIYNNTVGIEFTAGGSTGAGSVADNDFDNAAIGPANGTDLLLTNTSGAVTVGDDNTFAGTTASIEDQNAAQGIDLSTTTGNTFNGTTLVTSATPSPLSDLYTIEDTIIDAIDVSGYGLVRLETGNVYVTPNSFFAPAGTSTASIQRGVDAATAGDTVNVEAGIYTGDVEITKSLTLSGAQANVDPGASGWGGMAPESIIMGAGVNAPISIDAAVDNVTINGFVVESPDTGSGNYYGGIYIPDSTGITIQDNIITDNTAGVAVGDSLVTIENNLIEDNNTGLNVQPGAGTGVEFYVATSQASLISDNHFTNNQNNDVLLAAGVPISNITISGNAMTDSTGIFLLDASNIDITANSASAMIGTPVYVGGGDSNIDIGQNNFSNNPGEDAIVVDNPYSSYGVAANGSGISIHNNFLDGNDTGVDITTESLSASLTANENSITGNTIGLENDSTAAVDATENWWGNANGPTTPLNTYAVTGPTGDSVVGSNVSIVKWLTDSTDSDTSTAGFQPNVNNNIPTVTAPEDAANNDNEGSVQSVDAAVTATTDPVTYYWSVTKNGDAFGTPAVVGQTASLTNTYSFTPDDNGAYVVTVTVVDQDGASDTISTTLTINNVVPTAALTAVTDPQLEGSAEQFTASATDPSSIDQAAGFTYNWTVSKQHGSDPVIADYASGTSGPGAATATINFTPDDDGTYIITVTATDKDGGESVAATDTLTVANVAPTASLTAATGPLLEGSEEDLTASATDPSTADTTAGFTYNWTISKQHGSDPVVTNWDTGSSGPAATAAIAFTPDDDGTYVVTVTATDKDGGVSDVVTETLVIANVAPTAIITGTPTSPVNEGTPIALGSTVTDPSTVDTTAGFTYLWTVNKDGDAYAVTGNTASSFTFTPDDNGNYVVTLTATDKDGGFDTVSTSTITVLNVAPSDLALTVTTPINENGSTSLSGSFADPGSADTHTLTINWGDGTMTNPDIQTVVLDAGVLTFSGITHQYLQNNPDNAPYTISVTVTDKDGGTTSGTTPIEVDDVPPTIDLSASATVTNEGSVYTLKLGAVTDPGTEDVITSYSINWGDGTALFIGSGTPANTTETHTYADGPAAPTISVTIIDNDGTHSGAGVLNLTVNNVAPTAVFNNFGTINEGSSDTVQFTSAYDPSSVDTAAGLHYAYDLNDDGQFDNGAGDGTYAGSAGEPSTLNIPASFFSTPGPHTIVGRIIDKDGGYTDYTTVIDVDNVAPSVHLVSPANASTGSVFSTSGSWSDAGNDGPYTATVNYGDGLGVQTLTLTPAEQTSHTFNLSHTYASAGAYTITVTVTDSTGYATPVQYAPMTGTGTMTVNVANTTLRVTSVTATGDGFDIAFNRAIDINDIALYGSGNVVSPISVQLQTIGGGSTTIDGSLIWDAGTNIAHWIQTRGNLVNGSYMITLTSGTSGDNFHDNAANALDGNDDGTPGDNYSSTIVVNNPVVLSIPNFARGPGQAIITNSEGTQAGATGLPVTISDGTGVESVHFVLDYDPNVLSISTLAADLKTPGSNWAVTINSSTPGVLDIVVYSTNGSTLGSGPQTVLTFENVSVLTTATYGAASLLSFNSVLLNEALTNPIPVIAAETECKIVDLGDTTDAGSVGSGDAYNISRVVVHLDTGFAADPLTDPVLIADLTGDGTLSGLDAADASLMFVDPASQTQVPTPDGMGTGGVAGHDPEVESGLGSAQTITAGADSTAQASIQIDDNADGLSSADLTITYDPSLLTLTDGGVALSNALNSLGWAMTEFIPSAGTLNVGIYSAETGQPITTAGALDLIDLTFQTGSTLGVSTLGLPGQDLNKGGLTMTTNPGSITVAAPSVVGGVSVSGSAWAPAFLDYLASSGQGSSLGYAVTTANNSIDLPWVNLDTINIQFSENVTIADGVNALAVYGVNNPTYSAASFSYNSTTHVATWTFAAPFTADKLLLDLNSADVTDAAGNPLAGGDFQLNLNVLPGDVNNSQGVNPLDTSATRNLQGATPDLDSYSIFYDVNGSAGINPLDTSAVRNLQGSVLPSGAPQPPLNIAVDNDVAQVATDDDSVANASFLNAIPQGAASAGDTPAATAPVVVAVADAPAPAVAPVASPEASEPATPLAAAPLVDGPTTVPDVAAVADVPVTAAAPVTAPVVASPETSAPVVAVAAAAPVVDAPIAVVPEVAAAPDAPAPVITPVVGSAPEAIAPVIAAVTPAAPVVVAPITFVPAATEVADAPAPVAAGVVSNPETSTPATASVADVAAPSPGIETASVALVEEPVMVVSAAEWSPAPIVEQPGLSSVQVMPTTPDTDAIKGLLAQAIADASPGFIAPVVIDEAPMTDELAAALAVDPTSTMALTSDSDSGSAPAAVSTSILPTPVSQAALAQNTAALASMAPKAKHFSVRHPKAGLRLLGPDGPNETGNLIP